MGTIGIVEISDRGVLKSKFAHLGAALRNRRVLVSITPTFNY